MGWTLDYIDGLNMDEFRTQLTILDALDKARAHKSKKT